MNGNNVNLQITDTTCCCNCRNTVEKTVLITSTSQQIDLQNNYILNVISVTSTYFTVLIQNGVRTIIRNIYTNFPTQICLPDPCSKHLLTISGSIITVV